MTLEAVVMNMMMGFLMLTSHIDGGCDDIYIMMQCLSVTKNEHFLKRSVCLFVMFYPHFFKSRK